MQYEVKTFLGSGHKMLGESTLEVHFPSGRHLPLPILIDSDFKINIEVRGLTNVISNFKFFKVPLAAEYGDAYDSVVVNGLIGTDLLQHINFSTSKFMNGSVLRVDTGFIPFGNSEHFLYPNQLSILKALE